MQELIPDGERLVYLESVIERGQQTFVEVGTALMEIREQRLYKRDGWDTFEEYCQERWGWNRIRSHQLIDAARIVGTLTNDVQNFEHPLPVNDAQVRELAPLRNEPEAMREVWREVSETHGEQVTAAKVREAVQHHLSTDPPPPDRCGPTMLRDDTMLAL